MKKTKGFAGIVPMQVVPSLGGDNDECGCTGSAGYFWCEAKQKCVKMWEKAASEAESPALDGQ